MFTVEELKNAVTVLMNTDKWMVLKRIKLVSSNVLLTNFICHGINMHENKNYMIYENITSSN